MNWTNEPGTESQVGQSFGIDAAGKPLAPARLESSSTHQSASASIEVSAKPAPIRISKERLDAQGADPGAEVFTLTLAGETIQLLPFRNWGQLDVYKWRVQGKLPGTPAGLEVTFDHVKVGGETVLVSDPDACAKLERIFNEWLVLAEKNLQLARKKSKAASPSSVSDIGRPSAPLHFRVDVDKRGQVHIFCQRGVETVGTAGLTAQGFNGLFSQGLMRKPRSLDVGALHDWVELDGQLCSFEHGNNEAEKLERLLNDKYLPQDSGGQGKDILIFANPASPTGFDIQFPVTLAGVPEQRRKTLNDSALELLQDPARCGLLHPGLIVKICPPNFIFKRKTSEGGETYLEPGAPNSVKIVGDDGRERFIDLSRPVNYTRLGVPEVTAVFNHPAINRHQKRSSPAGPAASGFVSSSDGEGTQVRPDDKGTMPVPVIASLPRLPVQTPLLEPPVAAASGGSGQALPTTPIQCASVSDQGPVLRPNGWLKEILSRPPIRFDWFTCLIYSRIAQHFCNSREAYFGSGKCWSVALTEVIDITATNFKGLFLTQKSGLGYIGNTHLVRFHNGVMLLGTLESAMEAIGVHLVAVGLDEQGRFAFITHDRDLSKFDVPGPVLAQELARLREAGAVISSIDEVLASESSMKLVWSVPREQANPEAPEAVESTPIGLNGPFVDVNKIES